MLLRFFQKMNGATKIYNMSVSFGDRVYKKLIIILYCYYIHIDGRV